ncbi:MAG: helix-turn-helix domain-containing protein, partial [Bacteroidota bacterium]
LFRDGKSIPEIAAERDLTEGTVEQHLTTFIESGDLAITELLQIEQVNQILAESGEELHMVGKIKSALGDEFSYPEIRWVLAHKRWELASK